MSGPSDPLFEPDVIMPAQFFATIRRQAVRKKGECQLLIAVLEDAIHCFQKYVFATDNQSRRLFREAERWMMDERHTDDGEGLSFEYICEVLDLDADSVRRGMRRWRERRLASLRRTHDAA